MPPKPYKKSKKVVTKVVIVDGGNDKEVADDPEYANVELARSAAQWRAKCRRVMSELKRCQQALMEATGKTLSPQTDACDGNTVYRQCTWTGMEENISQNSANLGTGTTVLFDDTKDQEERDAAKTEMAVDPPKNQEDGDAAKRETAANGGNGGRTVYFSSSESDDEDDNDFTWGGSAKQSTAYNQVGINSLYDLIRGEEV